jgi:hypothetical protein
LINLLALKILAWPSAAVRAHRQRISVDIGASDIGPKGIAT